MEILTALLAWLQDQGLAGDIANWGLNILVGIPFLGGLIGGVIGIFKPSAAYKLGKGWGLSISTFMRKIPGIGLMWEFYEDNILGGFVELFKGIKAGADEDDKK